MFELVINGLVTHTFTTFTAAYDRMNSILRKNGYTIFRVGFSYDSNPMFHWEKAESPYVIVEIRDT